MIQHSDQVAELFTALHGAQGALSGVVKDGRNPAFKSRYATLEAVIDTAKPALQAHGLAFVQAPGAIIDGALEVTTMLTHTSGQWLRSTVHVLLAKRDPQGVGSACTYGCRYALMAMLGLPPVDDDGEAAMERGQAPARQDVARQPSVSELAAATGPEETVAGRLIARIAMFSAGPALREWERDPKVRGAWQAMQAVDVERVNDAFNARLDVLEATLAAG